MDLFLENFETFLKINLPSKNFQFYHYPLIPPGKLFRSQLSQAFFEDICSVPSPEKDEQIKFWKFFLEIHHTYSLVHDDLPAMDNDDFRRGKPSVHKKFGYWQAILSGDGLLNLSYQCLGHLPGIILPILLKSSTWALGPKGLIQGQALDLSAEMGHNFQSILRTHELKTGRLFFLCFLGPMAINNQNLDFQDFKLALLLGNLLGIHFQLSDDWDDFLRTESSAYDTHEANINPFILFPENSKLALSEAKNRLMAILENKKFVRTLNFLNPYF